MRKRLLRSEFHYPRRRLIRATLRRLARVALEALSDVRIVDEENLPDKGPLLVVGNHFSYIDPVAVIRVSPWPIEFVGGFNNPGAPTIVTWIPQIWGRYPVFRGTGSRYALDGAEAVLSQDGVLGIFPEGGNWATVLRPPRPGAAFLAALTGARILPIGLDGLIELFPCLRKGRRARVTIRIGKPFGPFAVTGRGRERRRQLEEVGHAIMRQIAPLIPPERRGYYSDDPVLRESTRSTWAYPWAKAIEGQVPHI